MAVYGLTGAALDEQRRIESATVQEIDAQKNQWVGSPTELEAAELARRIAAGDVVQSIFTIKHGDHSHTVPGALFRPVKFSDGFEGIELEQEYEGQRITDLVLHVKR